MYTIYGKGFLNDHRLIAGRQPEKSSFFLICRPYQQDGPVVYSASSCDSRFRGDKVPLGSSLNEAKKRKKTRKNRKRVIGELGESAQR